jgi:hypothetical protein
MGGPASSYAAAGIAFEFSSKLIVFSKNMSPAIPVEVMAHNKQIKQIF